MASTEHLAIDGLLEGFEKRDPASAEFSPGCWYSRDADSIFCFLRRDDHVARRVNNLLTTFISEEDETLVGIQIKSVNQLLGHVLLQVLRGQKQISLGALLAVSFERSRPRKQFFIWSRMTDPDPLVVESFGAALEQFGRETVELV